VSDARRFAPRGLWTLPGCGNPWTASKLSRDEPVHSFPRALGNRQTDAGFAQRPQAHVQPGLSCKEVPIHPA
jgi:hypothetical protein